MAAIERAVKELGQRAEALVLQAGHADPGAVTHKAERSATFTEDFTDPSRPVDDLLDSTFASRYVSQPMAKDRLPRDGAPAHVVYQLIKDIRRLDTTPALNLASFVTTWMEPQAEELIKESVNVNYVDTEEYPSSTEIHNRCVAMLARLWHSPSMDGAGSDAVGTACIGSSEAIMLGALSLLKRWKEGRIKAGKDASKPNLVMGAQTHLCWQVRALKQAYYWDVEERYVEMQEGRLVATPELMRPMIDENTIGIGVVFGSTYNGEFEDVAAFDAMCTELNEKNGWDLKIHVDGASGGFVAPFLYPDLAWDFRLKNVASINASGHKYGLVYPGLGWVMWRDADHLHESLVFWCEYLGAPERSITLNFSKSATNIVAQYYQFLRLGFSGYRKIMCNLDIIKRRLCNALEQTGHFELLSKDVGVPLVCFRLKKVVGSDGQPHNRLYDEFAVAERLRMRGWVLPAHKGPKGAEGVKMMRVTIREDFSLGMADMLIKDILDALDWLDTHFTFSKEQVEALAQRALDRRLSRLDTSIYKSIRDPTKKPVRPC